MPLATLFTNYIIPISKLLGNYNPFMPELIALPIIPISKLLGNYNIREFIKQAHYIIPISKLLGNYNHGRSY